MFDVIIDCDKLMGSLSNVRWAESVVLMVANLMEACIDKLRNYFCDVLQTQMFKSLGSVSEKYFFFFFKKCTGSTLIIIDPYNAELFCINHGDQRIFFNFKSS